MYLKIKGIKSDYRLSNRMCVLGMILLASIYITIFYLYLKKYYYHYDDAFITYTFAKHWAQGFGFVFHPEFKPIQGSSSFLYTVILGICSHITHLDVHIIGSFFSVLSSILMVFAFVALISLSMPNMSNKAKLTVFAASLFFQQPLLLSFGLETSFINALMLWCIYLVVKKERVMIVLLLSLIPLTRLDYGFYLPMFFMLLVYVYRQFKFPILLSVPCLVVTFSYILFSKEYFGEYLPHTWIAKSYFPASFSGVINWITFLRNHPFLVLLAAIAMYLLVKGKYIFLSFGKLNKYPISLIFWFFCLWSLVYTILLQYKKVPGMPWYYVTSLIFLYFASTSSLLQIYCNNKAWGILLIFFIAGLNLASSIHISKSFVGARINKCGHHDRREKIGRYLWENVPDIQKKMVLCYEIGKISYYSEAKVYDILGLVSREAIQGLKAKDTRIIFRTIFPDFVIGTEAQNYFPMMLLTDDLFKENYVKFHQIDDYTIWSKR